MRLLHMMMRPLSSGVDFVEDLCDNFGWRFVTLIFSVYFGVKGFLYPIVASGMLPYNKTVLKIDAKQHARVKVVAFTPWGMKAWFGLISDVFPIFGYKKRYYIVIATLVGTASFLLLGTLKLEPDTQGVSVENNSRAAVSIAAVLFFISMTEQSIVDLLTEGSYAAQMIEKPHTGSSIVTWVWTTYQFGGLLAACLAGPLTTWLSPKALFLVSVPFSLQVLVPVLLGYLPEKKITNLGHDVMQQQQLLLGANNDNDSASPKQQQQQQLQQLEGTPGGKRKRPPRSCCPCIAMDTALFRKNIKVFALAFVMAAAAMGLVAVEMLAGDEGQMIYACTVSVLLCGLSFAALPRTLALCNSYMFLCDALYIQIDGAMDYFYTAERTCLADGPHFSWNYYLTYTQVVGTVASLAGVWFFQVFLSKWKFRHVFWVSMSVRIFASIFDIIIVTRLNTRVLGIDDKFAYLLGDAIIYNMTYMINFMPPVVLTSKLCPKNMESTMYALLAGFQNFGQQVAKSIGVYMMARYRIKTEVPCDFGGLSNMIVLGHMILPALTIPLVFVMLPDKRLDEDIYDDAGRGETGTGGRNGADDVFSHHTNKVENGGESDIMPLMMDDDSDLGNLDL